MFAFDRVLIDPTTERGQAEAQMINGVDVRPQGPGGPGGPGGPRGEGPPQ